MRRIEIPSRVKRLFWGAACASLLSQAAWGIADLVPLNLSVSPTTVKAGGTLTVSYLIANLGNATAGANQTGVVLSANSSGMQENDTVLTEVPTQSLAPGYGFNQSPIVKIPVNTAPGTYYIWIVADINYEVYQNLNNDLVRSSPIRVDPPPPLSDLITQNISLSAASTQAGGTLTVHFTIRNQGTAAAVATSTGVALSTASLGILRTDPVLTTVTTTALDVGASVDQSVAITVPSGTAPGTYYVWVVADLFDEATQISISNDFLRSPAVTIIPPVQPADLIPQNITLSSDSANAGGALTVNFTILNQGGGPAAATSTAIMLSAGSSAAPLTDSVLATVSTPALTAGATADLNATVTIPSGTAAGTYYLWVLADVNHVVIQSNIANDAQHSPPVVVKSPNPPISLDIVSGNNQSAIQNAGFAAPLVVKVAQSDGGAPVPYAVVSWTVKSGAAMLSVDVVTSGADGLAQTLVTAGPQAGPVVIEASVRRNEDSSALIADFALTVLPPPDLSFANGADGAPGSIAPCGLARISGVPASPFSAPLGPMPYQAAGVNVSFDSLPAPVYSATIDSVTVQVPCDARSGVPLTVKVALNGTSMTKDITLLTAGPGIFHTPDSNGVLRPVAARPDGTWISPDNPARPGERIRLYVTGLGPATPALATNAIPPNLADALIRGQIIIGFNNAGVSTLSTKASTNQAGVSIVEFEVPADSAIGAAIPLVVVVIPPDGSGMQFSKGTAIAVGQ